MAERRKLPGDWLNDAVKGFLPGEDPDAHVAFDHPHLRVLVAAPRYLLAMLETVNHRNEFWFAWA